MTHVVADGVLTNTIQFISRRFMLLLFGKKWPTVAVL